MIASFIGFKGLSDIIGFGYTNLMFLGGNVLLVYQILHLFGPSDLRQKRISILIAIMHIGVGTQFIFDYKAFTILLASFFLIPRTLWVMDSEYFAEDVSSKYTRKNSKEFVTLACLMIIFFLTFPRFSFKARTANQLLASPQGGRLSEEVDMARSVGAGSDLLVFQIEGQDIGYIKCFALDKFDGIKWKASHWLKKKDRRFNDHTRDNSLIRSVRVFNFRVLGHCLPIDGFVQDLEADYPDRPYIAGDGGVKVGFDLRNNFSYVYWTKNTKSKKKLSQREQTRYLTIPSQSEKLTQWLNALIGDEKNPEKQAQKLATFFRSKFNYKIGAPNLNRINPLEEFIFAQREGHCERFASALAILLRLKGIPSRVVVGFLPVENNELGNFYNVRVKHAHAWTEAYFYKKGWQIIDATPYGRRIRLERRSLAFTFFEWIEYVWYSKIVEFGAHEQRLLLNFSINKLEGAVAYFAKYFYFILGLVVIILGIIMACNLNWARLFLIKKTGKIQEKRRKEARHFYSRMITVLEKNNYLKESYQTPLEFLNAVKRKEHPLLEEIRLVTNCFCQIYYGQIELPPETEKQLKMALGKLMKSRL